MSTFLSSLSAMLKMLILPVLTDRVSDRKSQNVSSWLFPSTWESIKSLAVMPSGDKGSAIRTTDSSMTAAELIKVHRVPDSISTRGSLTPPFIDPFSCLTIHQVNQMWWSQVKIIYLISEIRYWSLEELCCAKYKYFNDGKINHICDATYHNYPEISEQSSLIPQNDNDTESEASIKAFDSVHWMAV